MKKFIFLISIVLASNSFAACSQNDMTGKWWIIANTPTAVLRCVAYFNGANYDRNKSGCVAMADVGGEQEINYETASFTVRSDCRVAISVTDPSNGSVDNGYGWMSRDGEVIVGGTQNSSDGSASSIHAVKMY